MATLLPGRCRTVIQNLLKRTALLAALNHSSSSSAMSLVGRRDKAPPSQGNRSLAILFSFRRHESTKAQVQLQQPFVAKDDDTQYLNGDTVNTQSLLAPSQSLSLNDVLLPEDLGCVETGIGTQSSRV